MMIKPFRFATFPLAALLVAALAAPAAAVDREHQQLEADIRMLQEQAQQLQQMLATLTDALKQLNTKMDEQTAIERKAFADSNVQIQNLSGEVRIIREKIDETNVRLSTVSQDVEALHSVQQQSAIAPAQPPSDAAAGGAPPSAAGTPTPAPGQTPSKMFETAQADYSLGQYDLAIHGFEAYLSYYPKYDQADDALLRIGESYMAMKKPDWNNAVTAFNRVISDYPSSNSVPEAYYKRGLALENLGQKDAALQSYRAATEKYPDSMEATLAKQAIERLNRPTR